ncbi:cytochrome P450 protein [Rutstroemia sp. NJR-2017a BBW]|nr:cytochrome P450 protein [Rutstroemia sp. NJR-2017a BBW]
MNTYFDLLIRKHQEKIEGPGHGKSNIVRWLNFTTFDLISDLCFGESFDALRTEEYNSWIANILQVSNLRVCDRVMRAYPLIGVPVLSMVALFPSLQRAKFKHVQYTKDKFSRRLNTHTDRRDFMSDKSYILRHNDERGMSRDEIMKTSGTLTVAGSESTATLLSGALFHLLKSPQNLEILVNEIRTTFDSLADMNFVKLANLRYINACLQEAFRIYPPVPGVLPRRVSEGGWIINGYFLPEIVRMHKFMI